MWMVSTTGQAQETAQEALTVSLEMGSKTVILGNSLV